MVYLPTMSEENVMPYVAQFLKSFPQKRSEPPSDRNYPVRRMMQCFECCFKTEHYLEGILIDQIKIVKDKRKWPVVYMCDLCKRKRYFKYSPDKDPKFIPMKYRFSGFATVYSEPREYPLYNCFIQTRDLVSQMLKK